jgi:hypothetical protein
MIDNKFDDSRFDEGRLKRILDVLLLTDRFYQRTALPISFGPTPRLSSRNYIAAPVVKSFGRKHLMT